MERTETAHLTSDGTGLGLLEENLERVRHVGHVLLGLFGAGVEVIVREQRNDCDRETARGCDERFGDTTRDLAGGGIA